jgi:transposase
VEHVISAAAAVATEEKREVKGSVLDALRELLAGAAHAKEILALVSKVVTRNQELELLCAKLRERKNRGEHVSEAQLDFFLAELAKNSTPELQAEANRQLEEAANEHGGRPEKSKPPKQPPVRRRPSPKLKRVENPIPVPAEERACPTCGKPRRCLFHETTEVIDLIPAQVIVRLDQREVLGCDGCDGEMVRAPLGDKVVEGGAYGSRLVADLVVGKYRDGLPLHRQGQILGRLGLDIPSSSMADQIHWATELLCPVWRQLIEDVLAAKVMHLDSTGLPVRDRDRPDGIFVGSLWGYVGDQTSAVYLYTSTGKKLGQREGEIGPEQFLARRTGYTVADAATIFDKSFERPELIEIGCNMHARRYMVKALEAGDTRAAVPLAAFKALYDVEDSARDASPEQRLRGRQSHSRPVYDQLITWCQTYQPTTPPSSALGKAIQYLLNHRVALTRFLDDGILPIDNGIVERLHRRPAIGRRNYLFAGSHAAAERAAIAYSLLATCELLDVNPIEYLADILPRLARGVVIARDIPKMTPSAWKKTRDAVSASSPDA